MEAERGPLVLVAEDDDELRSLISMRLANAGLRVQQFEDGFELWDYLALAQAGARRIPMPNLILTDERMPGSRGLEVVRKLRTHDVDIPVVLLTAYPEDRVYDEAFQLGDTRVVSKPIDLDALADILWMRLWSMIARERSVAARTRHS